MHLLQLLRIGNLIIIAIAQVLLGVAVVGPLLRSYGIEVTNLPLLFLLLIITTIAFAAGGYIINDYYDRETDRINTNRRIPIEIVGIGKAIRWYGALTTGGIFSTLYLALLTKSIALGLILTGIPVLLWLYSRYLKPTLLTGNLLVALISAFSIFLTGWITILHLQAEFGPALDSTRIPDEIYTTTGFFALFAFLLTLVREIAKDAEDVPGDRFDNCRTLPIAAGLKVTKIVIILLISSVIALSMHFTSSIHPFNTLQSVAYLITFTVVPLAYTAYQTVKASEPSHFKKTSFLLKVSMITGIAYALIFYSQFANHPNQ